MEPQPMFRITTTVSSTVLSDDSLKSPLSSLTTATGVAPAARLRISENNCLTLYVSSDVESVEARPSVSHDKKAPGLKKSHSLSALPSEQHSQVPQRTSTTATSTPSDSWLSRLSLNPQTIGSLLMSPLLLEPPTQSRTSRPQILFYDRDKPHFSFTNFSPHKVTYKGKVYPTSEHLFQALKFEDGRPDIAEHIRKFSSRPSVALSEARRYQSQVRKDWKSVNIAKMDEVLWLKFTQHPDLRMELLSTGNAELIEDSDKDSFWGVGAGRKGRNELGKALERLRDKLVVSG